MFLYRFITSSEQSIEAFKASVRTQKQFEKDFDENRYNEKFWQELASISITPVSKFGLGKLNSFDFLAPCFGYQKDMLQYYGEIKFNFRQFGEDDAELQKHRPVMYTQKVCHKIGYYLQKIHDLDLIRIKVEFSTDEFGRVILLGASNILVRQARKVPTEDETMLGDYILRKITAENKAKEALQLQSALNI
jgi:hypothetical protein